jgi:hypothetical protein
MFKFKQFVQQALLAVALLGGTSAAMAGPTYQVTINSAAWTGMTGLIDFTFLGVDDAVAAAAHVSNASGPFGAEDGRSASVTGDIGSSLTFLNSNGFNFLTHAATFGGQFIFNVTFDGDFETIGGPDGTTFAVSLYSDGFGELLSAAAQFNLVPALNGELAMIDIASDESITTVNEVVAEVPEPSDLLLMLSALAMLGLVLRRQQR